MTTADAAFVPARRRSVRRTLSLRLMPLCGATLVLWAYIGSFYVYKTWYIATALVMTAVALLAAAGAIDTRGLLRAAALPAAYFAVLLLGAAWAEFPLETVRWVAIDSVELVVVILFYLAYRNATPRAVVAGLLSVIVPAVVMAIVMYRLDPTLTRLAHYSLPLLPIVVPFAWVSMAWSRRRWPGALILALSFCVLLAARSRTPLTAAVVAALLSMIAFRANFFDLFRRAFIAMLAVAVAIGILLAMHTTRTLVVTTFVRFTHISVHWGDVEVQAEGFDQTRADINELAFALGPRHFPAGLGYMNFMSNFERAHGYAMNLHSMYTTWFVEGGLLCLIVVAWMFWRQFVNLRRALRLRDRELRFFAQACLIASIAVAGMGLFHQMHQSPALWLLVGLGSGVGTDARERRHERRPRPRPA